MSLVKKIGLGLLALFVVVSSLWAQDGDASYRIQIDTAFQTISINKEIEILYMTTQSCDSISMPQWGSDIELIKASSLDGKSRLYHESLIIENGITTEWMCFSFTVRFLRAGQVTIPGTKFYVNGKSFLCKPFIINVPQAIPTDDVICTLELSHPDEEIFSNDTFEVVLMCNIPPDELRMELDYRRDSDASLINDPDAELETISSSVSQTYIDGEITRSYRYRLRANGRGFFTIFVPKITFGGREFEVQPLQIYVHENLNNGEEQVKTFDEYLNLHFPKLSIQMICSIILVIAVAIAFVVIFIIKVVKAGESQEKYNQKER